jgi:hypothetical protein
VRRDLIIPLDWVQPAQVRREDTERYDRILAETVAAEAKKGWRPAGPTDFAGLIRTGRTTLRRVLSPMNPPLTGRYLRAATVAFEKYVAHRARGRRRAVRGTST